MSLWTAIISILETCKATDTGDYGGERRLKCLNSNSEIRWDTRQDRCFGPPGVTYVTGFCGWRQGFCGSWIANTYKCLFIVFPDLLPIHIETNTGDFYNFTGFAWSVVNCMKSLHAWDEFYSKIFAGLRQYFCLNANRPTLRVIIRFFVRISVIRFPKSVTIFVYKLKKCFFITEFV